MADLTAFGPEHDSSGRFWYQLRRMLAESQMRIGRSSLVPAIAFALFGCAPTPQPTGDYAKVCSALGLEPGSDAFVRCIEQQQLRQETDVERARQLRESIHGSSKL
jgi:hypothetical protein